MQQPIYYSGAYQQPKATCAIDEINRIRQENDLIYQRQLSPNCYPPPPYQQPPSNIYPPPPYGQPGGPVVVVVPSNTFNTPVGPTAPDGNQIIASSSQRQIVYIQKEDNEPPPSQSRKTIKSESRKPIPPEATHDISHEESASSQKSFINKVLTNPCKYWYCIICACCTSFVLFFYTIFSLLGKGIGYFFKGLWKCIICKCDEGFCSDSFFTECSTSCDSGCSYLNECCGVFCGCFCGGLCNMCECIASCAECCCECLCCCGNCTDKPIS